MTSPSVRVLAEAPAGWSALLGSRPDASPGHEPRLWQALAAVFPGFESRFVAVEIEGAFAGGAPVMIERRAGARWLHALPFLLPGAPLAREGAAAAVDLAVGDAFAALAGDLGVSGGEWACDRAGATPVAEAALERVAGETRWFECSRLDLTTGIDALWRGVDRKTRQSITQARGRGLRFEERPERLDEACALHARQARRWAGHRAVPIALSRRLLESGAGRLFTVADDRGLLCATLALDGTRETLLWWSGAHEDARARHAYPVLMWSMAEWAAANGRARLNLGASTGLDPVAAFKRALGVRKDRYPVRWIGARHAGLLGRAVAAVQARLRAGRPRGATA